MGSIRPAAVAGSFYPRDPQTLRSVLRDCLAQAAPPQPAPAADAEPRAAGNRTPKALISPHAGYI